MKLARNETCNERMTAEMSIRGEHVAVLNVRDSRVIDVGAECSNAQQVGTFSLVGPDRKYEDGCGQLRFLHLPSSRSGLALDLNSGFDKCIRRKNTDDGRDMDNFLRWILNHKDVLKADDPLGDQKQRKPVDFVIRRGALCKMAMAPYEERDDWVVAATRHDGFIYVARCGTVSHGLNNQTNDRGDFRVHKLLQYLSTTKVGIPPDTDAPVNGRAGFCMVRLWSIGNHSLIISSEVSVYDPRAAHDCATPYVKLKTRRLNQEHNFRYIRLRWWAQSFLAGIPRILCGFTDSKYIVRSIKEFQVDELPLHDTVTWAPSVCLNSCSTILSFIKRCLTKDEPRAVHLFSFVPSSGAVVCSRLDDPGEYCLLPEWYLASV